MSNFCDDDLIFLGRPISPNDPIDFFFEWENDEKRPIHQNKAVLFADARYFFYPDLSQEKGFLIKGEKFSLEELLQNKTLAKRYEKGSMVIARLCPTDYHRFHFPFDCTPGKTKEINGYLYSVNPKALKKDIHILTQNKRVITPLMSEDFGEIQYIEVGATYVGSIHQTYKPGKVKKGEEKGYFSFGGSCIILLFEPDKIRFDQDLILSEKIEVRGLLGQSMGSLNK